MIVAESHILRARIIFGSSWNRVRKIGVSGREHARARKRERTRKRVVTRPEGKV